MWNLRSHQSPVGALGVSPAKQGVAAFQSMECLKEPFNILGGTWHNRQSKDSEIKPAFAYVVQGNDHASVLLLSIKTDLGVGYSGLSGLLWT